MNALDVEPTGSKNFGPCSCCGHHSRTVWGFVHRGGVTEAAYWVHWSLGKVDEHGAHLSLVVGKWGDNASPEDRQEVSVLFHRDQDGPAFMITDPTRRDGREHQLAARVLQRHEVVGKPLASIVFGILDAIWLYDGRIGELTGNAA